MASQKRRSDLRHPSLETLRRRPDANSRGRVCRSKRAGFTHQDIRYTSREDAIYAFALAMPPDGTLRIASLGTEKVQAPLNIAAVKSMAGTTLRWTRDAKALTVHLDDSQRSEKIAVIKIERYAPFSLSLPGRGRGEGRAQANSVHFGEMRSVVGENRTNRCRASLPSPQPSP